jgi:hypothetical protein
MLLVSLDTSTIDAVFQTDSFHQLFEEIADDAKVVVSNLVVCHHGKRIFASVGPSVLNIWKEVEFSK